MSIDTNILHYYPEKIVVKKSDNIDYVIIAIILILILIVWIILMYNVKNELHSGKNPPIYSLCPPYECATTVATGEKICPSKDGDMVLYDPAFQVCNPKYSCTDPKTPYAMLSNGATNSQGTCENNTICNCASKLSCQDNTLVLFNMVDNLYQIDPSQSNATFQQIPLITQNSENGTYSNVANQFCAIKANHLNRLASGACYFEDSTDVTLDEIEKCLQKNPCILGQMAFSPNHPDEFVLNDNSLSTIYEIPVGCYPITELKSGHIQNYCGDGYIPMYNKLTAKIECIQTV